MCFDLLILWFPQNLQFQWNFSDILLWFIYIFSLGGDRLGLFLVALGTWNLVGFILFLVLPKDPEISIKRYQHRNQQIAIVKLQGTWHWGLWYFWMFVQLSWAQNQLMHKTFGIFKIHGLHIRNRFLKTLKKVKNCGRSISRLIFTRFLMVYSLFVLDSERTMVSDPTATWFPEIFGSVIYCLLTMRQRQSNEQRSSCLYYWFPGGSQVVLQKDFLLKILSGDKNNESLQRVIDLGYRIDCQSMSGSIRMLSNEGASTREEHEPQIADVLA